VDCPEEALARAIQLSSTGKINELGEKARQFVEGQTWVRITAQFKDILEEVVKEKKNR
jgi:hypothetical protein